MGEFCVVTTSFRSRAGRGIRPLLGTTPNSDETFCTDRGSDRGGGLTPRNGVRGFDKQKALD